MRESRICRLKGGRGNGPTRAPYPWLSMDSAKVRISAVMSASLGSLVDLDYQKMPLPEAVAGWDLPSDATDALTRWGLPVIPGLSPFFQNESEPVLIPNLAGERERNVASPGQRLYRLASRGRDALQISIGAVAVTGTVLQVRPRPVTIDDIAPSLRESVGSLYHPAVSFVGSSVAKFVELSWRWRAAREILVELADNEPDYTRPDEEFEAHGELVRECQRIIVDHIGHIDSSVPVHDRHSFWTGIVFDW